MKVKKLKKLNREEVRLFCSFEEDRMCGWKEGKKNRTGDFYYWGGAGCRDEAAQGCRGAALGVASLELVRRNEIGAEQEMESTIRIRSAAGHGHGHEHERGLRQARAANGIT